MKIWLLILAPDFGEVINVSGSFTQVVSGRQAFVYLIG